MSHTSIHIAGFLAFSSRPETRNSVFLVNMVFGVMPQSRRESDSETESEIEREIDREIKRVCLAADSLEGDMVTCGVGRGAETMRVASRVVEMGM